MGSNLVAIMVFWAAAVSAVETEYPPRLRSRALETKFCGTRTDACTEAGENCMHMATGSTDGIVPVEIWKGNRNCRDMGFDFGWKSPDPGCEDHNQSYSDGYLSLTQLSSACTSTDCATNNVGGYSLDCKVAAEGDQFLKADITSTTDVYAFVKGGKIGGSLYFLEGGQKYTDLQTGTQQAISHIEFCFMCPSTAAPTTAAPSMAPTTETPSMAPTTEAPSMSPTTVAPTTESPTPCDTCKADPVMEDVPVDKTVCPFSYSTPEASTVQATDVCGNDLAGSIVVSQSANFPKNNTCAGTVTNTWSVKACNDSTPVTGTQTITVEDKEAPKFTDSVLADVVFSCPADYNETKLTVPFATDNCDAAVDVSPQAGKLEGCDDVEVTWVAKDNCGNEAKLSQTVKIDDLLAPILKSKAPSDVILKCYDAIPVSSGLIFSDNCGEELSVNSSDESVGGSYCNGNITKRTWSGPADICGNQAEDVVQKFKVLDQEPPQLPTDLPVFNAICPAKFDVKNIAVPNATDDCSLQDAITVEPYVAKISACHDVTVTWTATDQCNNNFTAKQMVQFTDTVAPTPFNGTVPADMTLKCTDVVPAAETVTFVDNCIDDKKVTAVEEDGGGEVCKGKKTVRKWKGPVDECGNAGAEYQQVITVVDVEAPVLPETMKDVSFTCPSDFGADKLTPPAATDDCDDDVSIVASLTPQVVVGCGNISVTYFATDVCDKTSNVSQTVYFTDEEPPSLQGDAPANVTLKCKDPMPPIAKLTFTENCGDSILAEGVESNATGSVCDGQVHMRTWKGPTDACGNIADDITQAITVSDQEPPQLPANLQSLSFKCPQDFVLADLVPPVATDDCSATVNVTGSATELNKCEDVTITWKAVDDCGKSTTLEQTAKFVDTTSPSLFGSSESDITVGCGQFPAEKQLTFSDFCSGDINVFSKDSLPSGNVCTGQKFTRTWEGPSDGCDNKADDVTQTITVLDLGPPDLPETMPDVVLTCASDFDEHALVPPNATDDCDKTVLVEKTVPTFDKCKNEFEIVWTAVDECSKTDTVAQNVKFSGSDLPSISCPDTDTFTGDGGSFTHVVSYGDCYKADDVTITYEATCTDCDGGSCSITVNSDGEKITISGAPAWSKVEWIAKLDYGCGVVSTQCSAMQTRGGETMFGEPNEEEGKKLISDVDDGANRWGWYKEFTFQAAENFSFTMHAGAGQSDLSKGFEAGTVVVSVVDCATTSASTADWSGIGDNGRCINDPEDSHHLHVGLDLPRSKKGDITFGPGQFTAGCCNKNATCYIAVHGVVEEAKCGAWGCEY